MDIKVIVLIGAAAVVFGTGFRLTGVGRPYLAVLLTIHKLVALAATVGAGVLVYQANGAQALSRFETAVAVLAGVLILALFVTGGVISAAETASPRLVWLHRLAAWSAVAATAASIYLAGARD